MGLTKRSAIRYLWTFYGGLPVSWRAHQLVRTILLPFSPLLDALVVRDDGERKTLVDLGCGHGLFLALAQHKHPTLELIGMDLSPEKIAVARDAFASAGIAVRDLAVRDIRDFHEQAADVVTIIDVMYLVPIDNWDGILQACYRCLKPGGRLLLKEMDPARRIKFGILQFEEWLAVRVLGWTLGSTFTFPSAAEIRQRMERAGFTVEQKAVDAGYFAPHCLWIGTVPR